MTFLFVVQRFHPNLLFAVKALQANGHTVQMVVAKPSSGYGVLEPILIRDNTNFVDVINLIKKAEPDLIIIRKYGKGWISFYWMTFLIRRKIRTVEYSLRPSNRKSSGLVEMLRAIGVRPRTRISPVIRRPADANIPRSFFIPFPIAIEPGAAAATREIGRSLRILCVGKLLEKRKQQDLLLDAAEPLATRYPFTITLVGTTRGRWRGVSEDHFAELRRRAEEGPLASRIRILPDVRYAEMPSVYRSHGLFVLPALEEPLGFSVLEAMSHGCAVVVADTCGAAGYVTPECGVTFRERSVENLRAALDRLLADPGLVARMGRAAVETVSRDHALETYAARMETLARFGAPDG